MFVAGRCLGFAVCQVVGTRSFQASFKEGSTLLIHFFPLKTLINCVLQKAQAGSPEQDLALSYVFVQNETENGYSPDVNAL